MVKECRLKNCRILFSPLKESIMFAKIKKTGGAGASMNKQVYIAVLDSGVGGISVLRHLLRELPNERFLYFGDSANAPYGSRTTEEVRELTLAAVKKLVEGDPI